jgi:hypothetical protein
MKNSTLKIRGKSGRSYVFHTYTLPVKLMTVGGVYIYLKLQKNKDFKVLKIGGTPNFSDEMKTNTAQKIGATHITAIQKNSKGKRDLIIKDISHLMRRR